MTLPTRETMDALDRAWDAQWPRNTVGGVHVGDFGAGTRVEFHHLPTRRRRAEHVLEYAESLRRSRALLSALVGFSDDPRLFIVTRAYELDEEPATDQRDRWLQHFVPAVFWRSHLYDPGTPDDPEDPALYEQLYLSQVDIDDPVLLSLIILAADDRGSDPLVFSADVSWVLSPCDEGAHLAALDVALVEQLRVEYPDWFGELDQTGIPAREVSADWVVVVEGVTQPEARAVLDVIEGSGTLGVWGGASVRDPQAALNPYFGRRDAQLLRIALSDEPQSVFSASEQTTRLVTPAEARAEIRGDDFYDHLVKFADTSGYRDPGEAVDGRLERRLWDPFEDYTGIDGGD